MAAAVIYKKERPPRSENAPTYQPNIFSCTIWASKIYRRKSYGRKRLPKAINLASTELRIARGRSNPVDLQKVRTKHQTVLVCK